MKLTKQQESEALKLYYLYWESYIKGDLETFSSTLDDAFEMIGTSESEVAHNKAEGIAFYKAQMEEVVGKAEMRNRAISAKALNGMFLINENCDVYVLVEPDWTFYSKIRISTLLHETDSGWKVIQQHGSFPDMRVQEGETLAIDKITKENLELRDAIKRRTVELENKNQELAVEAALEKVRAVAMGMREPADMVDICRIISMQLGQLGLPNIRNIQTLIVDEQKNSYLNYQYFPGYDKGIIEDTDYTKHPTVYEMVQKIRESADAYFSGIFRGEELTRFKTWRDENHQFPDPLLNDCSELPFYFYSIGNGALGLSTYGTIDDDALNIFKQFHKVFALAYQRFSDIKKAKAQAREAQVEAALERVRSRAMAMHSSEDVGECVVKMFAELTALGVDEGTRFGIDILNHDNENNQLWTARKDGEEVNMHIGNLDMSRHPLLKSAREAWKAQVPFHKYILEGEDLINYYNMLNTAPDFKIQIPLEKLPKKEIQHCFIFEHGFFYAFSPYEFQPDLIQITKRFSSLFEQTYRRYLDLVRAEAQAREAQIEAALERVRSRSMGMQRGEELKIVVKALYDQLKELGFMWGVASIIIMDPKTGDMDWWMEGFEDGFDLPGKYHVPFFDHRGHKEQIDHWKSGSAYAVVEVSGEEKKTYDDYYFFHTDFVKAPEPSKQLMMSGESVIFSMAFLKYGALSWAPSPLDDHQAIVLQRFAKVFEQTYTRFLDLQKAEAQAREANIEGALEKVRSRSLAMHKSDELTDVVSVLFEKLKDLQVPFTAVGIATGIDGSKDLNAFVCGQNNEGLVITNYRLPYFNNPVPKDLYNALEKQLDYFVGHYSKEEKDAFYEYVIEHTAEFRHLPEDIKRMIFGSTSYTISMVAVKNAVFNVNDFEGKVLAEEEVRIIKRFANVFDQAYTRFLDLQKAEKQARVAQIEAALERVRAAGMAMHRSEDLAEASTILFEQLKDLGVEARRVGFALPIEEKREFTVWSTIRDDDGKARLLSAFLHYDQHPIYPKMIDKWHRGQKTFGFELHGPDLQDYYKAWNKTFKTPDSLKKTIKENESEYYQFASFQQGLIYAFTATPLSSAEHQLLSRFAKAFEQTYTRFLDLQKAEAQAREAQIQLALERVRAKTMAMKTQSDLLGIIELFGEQLNAVGVRFDNVTFIEGPITKKRDWDLWSYAPEAENTTDKILIPYIETPYFTKTAEAVEAYERTGNPIQVKSFTKKEKNEFLDHYWKHVPAVSDEFVNYVNATPGSIIVDAFLEVVTVSLVRWDLEPYTAEELAIFERFAKEFKQTYIRFLDIKKAEAQAREAKIETALEKVRSRTMGMQSSEELPEVANLLFLEVQALGIPAWSCGHNVLAADKKSATAWMSSEGTLQKPFQLRLYGEASFDEMGEFVVSNKVFMEQELGGKALIEHYNHMKSFPDLKPTFDQIEARGLSLPTFQINHLCKFSHGFLLFITYEPVPDAHDIFRRFTKVFDQTYTRFLDLQKAEAQAREAKIEVALEKVRSRTMGMQKSDELADVANVLFQEMNELVHNLWTCGFVLCEKDREEDEWWLSLEDGFSRGFFLPNVNDYAHGHLYEGWLKKDDFRTVQLEGDKLQEHYDWLMEIPIAKSIFDDMEAAGMQRPEWQKLHAAYFSKGYLVIITREPCAEEAIFKRFAQVFDLTYTRFLDLKKAEEQAREAQVELSLERVRAQVTGMQESSDLFDIVVSMRSEFISLGHEADYFWHMLWLPDVYEMSMTTEAGDRLGMVINIPKFVHDQIPNLAEWEKGNNPIFVLALDADQAWDYIDNMNTHGRYEQVDPHAPTREDIEHIGGLTFIIARTTHGEIGYSLPGVVPEPPKDSLDTLVRFAGVFDLAYKRFEDLKAAERQALLIREERDRLEIALNQLEATKDQLIQQEKLASLGQLTAGIAHEIQNPLNFVNNFSEVSIELVDE
ncbi:MAG TPA: nuclear transport factor 2 family protein, partial [Saprospiraceae bacterium]|nr:nuclear transport factor 2 family protein [Saprospiraceae bacterium]